MILILYLLFTLTLSQEVFLQPQCSTNPQTGNSWYLCGYEDAGNTCANYNEKYPDPSDQIGVLVLASIFAMTMAFGIGSNDAANSWATSVGSGAISLRYAVLLGGIFEWLGAATMGYGVSKTISKGVAKIDDADCWACGFCDSKMGLHQAGMFAALFGASCFLLLATRVKVPVSTTHAIVGGVVGVTVAGVGGGCLNWKFDGGLGGIIASWVISPVLSGIIALVCFALSDRFVMKSADPFRNSLIALPLLYFCATFVILFVGTMKAKAIKNKFNETGRTATAAIGGAIVALAVQLFVVPNVRAQVESLDDEKLQETEMANLESGSKLDVPEVGKNRDDEETNVQTPDSDVGGCDLTFADVVDASFAEEFASETKTDVKLDLDDQKDVTKQKTDLKSLIASLLAMGYTTEQSKAIYTFRYLLVFNACLESIAHGSNDTANATGAFSSVYQSYNGGLTTCDKSDSAVWILVVAGLFVFLGITTYGYKVIQTIGKDIVDIDFHRGFYIEFGSTCATLAATYLEFPVSTTHCQIGALVFVGAYDLGAQNISWGLFTKIAISWIVTLPISGGVAAIITATLRAAWA